MIQSTGSKKCFVLDSLALRAAGAYTAIFYAFLS